MYQLRRPFLRAPTPTALALATGFTQSRGEAHTCIGRLALLIMRPVVRFPDNQAGNENLAGNMTRKKYDEEERHWEEMFRKALSYRSHAGNYDVSVRSAIYLWTGCLCILFSVSCFRFCAGRSLKDPEEEIQNGVRVKIMACFSTRKDANMVKVLMWSNLQPIVQQLFPGNAPWISLVTAKHVTVKHRDLTSPGMRGGKISSQYCQKARCYEPEREAAKSRRF